MSARVRRIVFLCGAAGLAVLLLAGLAALPASGRGRSALGDALVSIAVDEQHTASAVAAVVLDFRGFDTVGEELILFTAVMGVSLLLRAARDAKEAPASHGARPYRPSEAVRAWALGLVAPTVVLGLSIVAHGHLTPGGGFQGGALLGGAVVLVYLGNASPGLTRREPEALWDAVEGLGAGGFVLLGFLGLLAGRPYLTNVLPAGELGSLWSAGLLPLANICIGTAVAAGLALIFFDFREHTIFAREGFAREGDEA